MVLKVWSHIYTAVMSNFNIDIHLPLFTLHWVRVNQTKAHQCYIIILTNLRSWSLRSISREQWESWPKWLKMLKSNWWCILLLIFSYAVQPGYLYLFIIILCECVHYNIDRYQIIGLLNCVQLYDILVTKNLKRSLIKY